MSVVPAIDVEESICHQPVVAATGAPAPDTATLRSRTVEAVLGIERSLSGVRVVPALAVVAALWWGQAVLIPVVLSVVISYALEPFIARVECRYVTRAVAVPVVLAIVVAGSVGTAYALRGEAIAFVNRLPGAAHTVAQAIAKATQGKPGAMARVQQAAQELEHAASGTVKKDQPDGVTPVRIEEPTFRWSDWVRQGGYGAVGFAAQMLAVVCLVYYILVAGDLYKRKLVRIVPTLSDKKITVEILAEIDRQIERFLLARIVISAVVGFVIWGTFRLFGLEDAGVWGVLSAVLFAVPIAGPTIVVVGAAVAGFVQFDSLGIAAAVGAACMAIAAVEGNLLTPWLMSRVGDMNAVAVFVSLLFWGWLWGIWGLLLAVPITAGIKAASERIDGLSAVAELLKE
jgi:predicted PurR-regulated permease PerM